MSEENERKFREWEADVQADHADDDMDEAIAELVESPFVGAMIKWASEMDMNQLTFILALVTSELIGRVGVEMANEVFASMMEDKAIQSIGALVHAGRIMEMGGTPAEFEDDDEALTSEAILDDGQETA